MSDKITGRIVQRFEEGNTVGYDAHCDNCGLELHGDDYDDLLVEFAEHFVAEINYRGL